MNLFTKLQKRMIKKFVKFVVGKHLDFVLAIKIKIENFKSTSNVAWRK